MLLKIIGNITMNIVKSAFIPTKYGFNSDEINRHNIVCD